MVVVAVVVAATTTTKRRRQYLDELGCCEVIFGSRKAATASRPLLLHASSSSCHRLFDIFCFHMVINRFVSVSPLLLQSLHDDGLSDILERSSFIISFSFVDLSV